MEDNNAINEQLDAVNYENLYNELLKAYSELKQTAEQLFNRVKQLENTWMLTRAEYLFKVIDNNKFNVNVRQNAQEELENFLFPPKQEVPEEDKKED